MKNLTSKSESDLNHIWDVMSYKLYVTEHTQDGPVPFLRAGSISLHTELYWATNSERRSEIIRIVAKVKYFRIILKELLLQHACFNDDSP